jgi:Flp pilus assembly protein TadD
MASARSAAALLALALVVAGCSTQSLGSLSSDPTPTGSLGEGSLKETSLAAQAWRKDPSNKKNGLTYARGLMALERSEEAVKVVEELAHRNPDDLELAAYLGKIMVQSGRLQDGEKQLRKAVAGGRDDWRIRSALGSALDQQGRYQEARQCYEEALKRKPDEVSVINNLGMSYALEGDLKTAETHLRRAMGLPKAMTTPSSGRTSPWWSACRAASTRPGKSPAATCRPTRSRPMSPILSACCPSPIPGSSSGPRSSEH